MEENLHVLSFKVTYIVFPKLLDPGAFPFGPHHH